MADSAERPTAPNADSRPISWRRNLYALWVAQSLAIIGFSLRDSYLPFYLKDLGDLSQDEAALWSGLVQAGGAGVMTIAAPLAMLLFLNTRGWLQIAVLLLVGLTLLATTPVLMALVLERARETRALANGIYMALNFVITALATLTIGRMADLFGLHTGLSISAWVMLAGVPFVLLLPERERQ